MPELKQQVHLMNVRLTDIEEKYAHKFKQINQRIDNVIKSIMEKIEGKENDKNNS